METRPTHTVTRMASTAGETKKGGFDIQLICYFALWYLGNYYCKLPPPVCEICALMPCVFLFLRDGIGSRH